MNQSNYTIDSLSAISMIIPHLFITNWKSSEDKEKLEEYKINAILTIERQQRSSEVMEMYAKLDIDYHQIYADDSTTQNLEQYFDETRELINKYLTANKNIIVNCWAGMSRSVTIVAYYLLYMIYHQQFTFPATLSDKNRNELLNNPNILVHYVLHIIQSSRPMIQPNWYFVFQLIESAKKLYQQTQLNKQLPTSKPITMCDESWIDTNGKQATIICLTADDFDSQGNLINFKDVNGVILWFSPMCGHCVHMKPSYANFSNMLGDSQIRAFAVDLSKQNALASKIDPKIWGFSVRGVPAITAYYKGKFYSEYGIDNPQKFRTADDILEYALGIGKVPVEIIN